MNICRRVLLASITLLLLPMALSADVLVVSRNTNSVVIFDDAGDFVSNVALPASESVPGDIAQAPNGDIFILLADATVHRFDSAMTFIESWSAPGQYYGINVDESGLVYAAGSGSPSVGVYSASGVLQTSLTPAGGSNLRDSVRVGTDTWISNFTGPKIDVIDSGGTDIGDVTSPPTPFGMQLAPNGDVWVVDQNSHEVWRITPAGTQALTFDADNGPNGPMSGQLRYLGVGPDGSVFIPHRESNIVDIYDDAGIYVATLTHASLDGPDGILVTGVVQPPSGQALFNVTKTFSDGATGDVEVTLTCNGGSPLVQSFTISGGGPGVTFTVNDLPDTGANCEVTESGGPDGYTAEFNGGSGCAWTGVTGGSFTCAITNSPALFDFVVDFEWDDTASEATGTVDVSLYCTNVLNPDGSLDTSTRVSSGYQATATTDTEFSWLDVGAVNDDEDDDGPVNPTTCWAMASGVTDSAVEVSGCDPFTVSPGDDEANCTMTASVFFEGIPTLSQYGLAIMVLLMLGVGFVGFRRFV